MTPQGNYPDYPEVAPPESELASWYRKRRPPKEELEATAGRVPVGLRHPWEFAMYVNFLSWPEEDFREIKQLANAIHGKVYLMEHIPSRKPVVVKRMANENVKLSGPQQLENAMNEIGVSKFLTFVVRSEFIVRMLDCYRDKTYTYFVTEFAEQGELFNEVITQKRFSEAKTKYYMHQVLRAVKSMHANGIIHRDISLENTLLHSDDTIRVVDFGQAAQLFDKQTGREKRITGRAGKSYYRAPEMYQGDYLGRPVDIFACGVMMFIMVLGTPPWQQATATDERFAFIQKYSIEPLLQKWDKRSLISDALLDLMKRMMTSDPQERISLDEVFSHPWFEDAQLEKPPWEARASLRLPHRQRAEALTLGLSDDKPFAPPLSVRLRGEATASSKGSSPSRLKSPGVAERDVSANSGAGGNAVSKPVSPPAGKGGDGGSPGKSGSCIQKPYSMPPPLAMRPGAVGGGPNSNPGGGGGEGNR
uniref:Protein kinase domain-containing protein n=1 Tax=Chromera velia CCMP2878 TaxID=1169474 RepID=A0A0G4HBI5_9ALVE|eukprot:Cvel_25970.t1-p1 / transcript=Cvel_25970.t1 / gene=Cvel_25970 / organism=Chromera_velia_CCMP2878 / gene_product=Spindle assembly checkpoint kinase, putative / transcript_product=Spindle assembly checkpoint kinase, putative / location=Cvel_scaffold3014:7670-10912(-) / protein_length=475 / sequence_SO=supercontig / SO=protein_coding / is_pseudo=false